MGRHALAGSPAGRQAARPPVGTTAPKRSSRGAKTAGQRRSVDSALAREWRGQARRQTALGILSPEELATKEAHLAVKVEIKKEIKVEDGGNACSTCEVASVGASDAASPGRRGGGATRGTLCKHARAASAEKRTQMGDQIVARLAELPGNVAQAISKANEGNRAPRGRQLTDPKGLGNRRTSRAQRASSLPGAGRPRTT